MDDGQWIRRAVAEHERPLTQYAVHLLHDAEAARDVVQETFCRLCRESRGELDGRLAEWLYTVCRNRAMDVLRKDRRMKPLSDTALETSPGDSDPPSAPMERSEDASWVLQAVELLPRNQQEVVRLKFQQDLSYRQIADVTGLSVGNVGYLLHTALNTLRKTLIHD